MIGCGHRPGWRGFEALQRAHGRAFCAFRRVPEAPKTTTSAHRVRVAASAIKDMNGDNGVLQPGHSISSCREWLRRVWG